MSVRTRNNVRVTGSGSTRFWGDATVIAVAYLLAYGAVTRGATYRELYNAVMTRAGSA